MLLVGGILTVIIAVIVIVGIVVWSTIDHGIREAERELSSSDTASVQIHHIPERPGWEEMKAHVNGMHETYRQKADDDSIWDDTRHGRDTDPRYVEFFLLLLQDHSHALLFE